MSAEAERLPEVTPTQLRAQECFERAYARPVNELQEKAVDYSEAIRLDPALAVAFFNRGVVKFELKDVSGTIADYDEAICLDPTASAAYYNRGNIKGALKDFRGSIDRHHTHGGARRARLSADP